jgi:hypothetical protein
MTERYFARSASDRTEDWPFWYVADRQRGNLNCTPDLMPELRGYLPFVSRQIAERLAAEANASGYQTEIEK